MDVVRWYYLHGICYDFLCKPAICTRKKGWRKDQECSPGSVYFRHLWFGMVIGTTFSGYTADSYLNADGSHQWSGIWMVPAYIAIAVRIYFILFFKEKKDIQAAA